MSSAPAEPSRLARLRGLSGRERWLLARAVVLLPVVERLLPRVGYARMRAWLGRRRPPRPGVDAQARIESTVRMVDLAVSRGPGPSACLSQSLVLWTLLRSQGVASEIRFGVRSGGETLDAHAWVEVDGRPLNETPERVMAYQPLQNPRV